MIVNRIPVSYTHLGTARHQDYFQKGKALRDELHVQDVLLLKEMGGNFLRVSHYPQDPVIMEMCDKPVSYTHLDVYKRQEETSAFFIGIYRITGLGAEWKESVCRLSRSALYPAA